jgi:hypothetical protein
MRRPPTLSTIGHTSSFARACAGSSRSAVRSACCMRRRSVRTAPRGRRSTGSSISSRSLNDPTYATCMATSCMRTAGAAWLAGFGRASMRPGVANQAQHVQGLRALMRKRGARVLRASSAPSPRSTARSKPHDLRFRSELLADIGRCPAGHTSAPRRLFRAGAQLRRQAESSYQRIWMSLQVEIR